MMEDKKELRTPAGYTIDELMLKLDTVSNILAEAYEGKASVVKSAILKDLGFKLDKLNESVIVNEGMKEVPSATYIDEIMNVPADEYADKVMYLINAGKYDNKLKESKDFYKDALNEAYADLRRNHLDTILDEEVLVKDINVGDVVGEFDTEEEAEEFIANDQGDHNYVIEEDAIESGDSEVLNDFEYEGAVPADKEGERHEIEQDKGVLDAVKNLLLDAKKKVDEGSHDSHDYEAAFEEAIESISDGRPWWEVTNHWDIFDALFFEGLTPEQVIDEIVNHIDTTKIVIDGLNIEESGKKNLKEGLEFTVDSIEVDESGNVIESGFESGFIESGESGIFITGLDIESGESGVEEIADFDLSIFESIDIKELSLDKLSDLKKAFLQGRITKEQLVAAGVSEEDLPIITSGELKQGSLFDESISGKMLQQIDNMLHESVEVLNEDDNVYVFTIGNEVVNNKEDGKIEPYRFSDQKLAMEFLEACQKNGLYETAVVTRYGDFKESLKEAANGVPSKDMLGEIARKHKKTIKKGARGWFEAHKKDEPRNTDPEKNMKFFNHAMGNKIETADGMVGGQTSEGAVGGGDAGGAAGGAGM